MPPMPLSKTPRQIATTAASRTVTAARDVRDTTAAAVADGVVGAVATGTASAVAEDDRYSEGDPQIEPDDVLIPVAGILDVLDNYAFVRTSGYLPGPNDVYVSLSQVRRLQPASR